MVENTENPLMSYIHEIMKKAPEVEIHEVKKYGEELTNEIVSLKKQLSDTKDDRDRQALKVTERDRKMGYIETELRNLKSALEGHRAEIDDVRFTKMSRDHQQSRGDEMKEVLFAVLKNPVIRTLIQKDVPVSQSEYNNTTGGYSGGDIMTPSTEITEESSE